MLLHLGAFAQKVVQNLLHPERSQFTESVARALCVHSDIHMMKSASASDQWHRVERGVKLAYLQGFENEGHVTEGHSADRDGPRAWLFRSLRTYVIWCGGSAQRNTVTAMWCVGRRQKSVITPVVCEGVYHLKRSCIAGSGRLPCRERTLLRSATKAPIESAGASPTSSRR